MHVEILVKSLILCVCTHKDVEEQGAVTSTPGFLFLNCVGAGWQKLLSVTMNADSYACNFSVIATASSRQLLLKSK